MKNSIRTIIVALLFLIAGFLLWYYCKLKNTSYFSQNLQCQKIKKDLSNATNNFIDRAFYSSKKDSCLYVEKGYNEYLGWFYEIIDPWRNESLWYFSAKEDWNDYKNKYLNRVKELE